MTGTMTWTTVDLENANRFVGFIKRLAKGRGVEPHDIDVDEAVELWRKGNQ